MNDPTRRDVLRAGAHAGLGLAAAGLAVPAFGARRERWIRPALKVGMIQEGTDLVEKFRIAKAAGFEGVELDSPGAFTVEEVRAAKGATGLDVPGVVLSTHWGLPFNHADEDVRARADASLAAALRECAAFGGTSVLVVPAVVNQAMPYAEAYDRSQAAMRRAAPAAQGAGVQIAFENVWNGFLLSPLEAARYSDELNDGLGEQVFAWHFDIGNVVNFGWPEQWIDTLGDRIVKLDVKEFSRTRRDNEGLWKGFGVEIGDGDAGWNRVRAALRRIGYTGWAAAEVQGGDSRRLADIASRIDRVFDQG